MSHAQPCPRAGVKLPALNPCSCTLMSLFGEQDAAVTVAVRVGGV